MWYDKHKNITVPCVNMKENDLLDLETKFKSVFKSVFICKSENASSSFKCW